MNYDDYTVGRTILIIEVVLNIKLSFFNTLNIVTQIKKIRNLLFTLVMSVYAVINSQEATAKKKFLTTAHRIHAKIKVLASTSLDLNTSAIAHQSSQEKTAKALNTRH